MNEENGSLVISWKDDLNILIGEDIVIILSVNPKDRKKRFIIKAPKSLNIKWHQPDKIIK